MGFRQRPWIDGWRWQWAGGAMISLVACLRGGRERCVRGLPLGLAFYHGGRFMRQPTSQVFLQARVTSRERRPV